MGSATTQALTAVRKQVGSFSNPSLAASQVCFELGRVLGENSSLLSALTSYDADAASKQKLVTSLIGKAGAGSTSELILSMATSRWSRPTDLLVGLEEAGVRIASRSEAGLEQQLLGIKDVIGTDAELELALGSKLSDSAAKLTLAKKVFSKKTTAGAMLVFEHLLRQPRGRRIGAMLQATADVAADESGAMLATAFVARELPAAQLGSIQKVLVKRYGREVRVNVVVDPDIIGGIKIRVGDDVLDGSLATRMNELRQKLAS